MEVDEIQSSLANLAARLNRFEQRAKSTLFSDQTTMLDNLRLSVNSVEETVSLLKNSTLSLISWFVSEPTLLSEAVVQKQVTSLERNFRQLRHSADTGLENVKKLNKESHDFDAELESLRADLQAINDRT